MPLIVEIFFIIFIMMGSFFLAFMFIFLLALFLSPIERGLSKMIWGDPPKSTLDAPKVSFNHFSKKHVK